MVERREVSDASCGEEKDNLLRGTAPSLEEQLADAKRLSDVCRKNPQKSGITRDGQPSFEITGNGDARLAYTDHTVAKVSADGTIRTQYENGVEVTRTKDVQVTTRPDSGEIQEFKDGTVVIKTRDGVEAEAESNGVMRLTDSEGKSIAVDRDGNCQPPGGKVERTKNAEGHEVTTITGQDFTVERTDDGKGNVVTVIRGQDGSAAQFNSDGRVSVGQGESSVGLVAKEYTSYTPGPTWGQGKWEDFKEKPGSPTLTEPGEYRSKEPPSRDKK